MSETIIVPAGMKALSIDPLNWQSDGTPADKSLHLGAVFEAGGEPVPALCGACIGKRGELMPNGSEDLPTYVNTFLEKK